MVSFKNLWVFFPWGKKKEDGIYKDLEILSCPVPLPPSSHLVQRPLLKLFEWEQS